MPISLGPRKSPIDLSIWDFRCQIAFGRKIPLGIQLSRRELWQLGFYQAAGELPKSYDLEVSTGYLDN